MSGVPDREESIHDFRVRAMDGTDVPLSRHAGKVVLLVNTASKCGFTPQLEGLERLAARNRDRGFEVLGFPSNDFMGQEPGSDEEIAEFCSTRFGVRFPLFSKLKVKGSGIHPLFEYLTERSAHPGAIRWNFTKFLAGRDGRIKARFAPTVAPEDASIERAIEAELGTE